MEYIVLNIQNMKKLHNILIYKLKMYIDRHHAFLKFGNECAQIYFPI